MYQPEFISRYADDRGIKDEGLKQLCEREDYSINQLSLCLNGITAKGIYYISKAKGNFTRNLIQLYLYSNRISNIGCKYLSQTDLSNLINLEIASNQIGSQGVLHLTKAIWKKLQELDIQRNSLNDEALIWIGKLYWPKVKNIKLSDNRLTYEGSKMLMKSQVQFELIFLERLVQYEQQIKTCYVLFQKKFRSVILILQY